MYAPAQFSASLLVLIALSSPSTASAQGITGRLIDDATGAPVPDAVITLEDDDGNRIDQSLTTAAGEFELRADEAGQYIIRAEHIAYASTTSPAISLEEGVTLDVELRVAARAVLLAPLTVVARREITVRDPRLERWGYYENKELYGKEGNGLGFAYFLEAEDIRPTAFALPDILRDLPGIYVRSTGGRSISVRGRRGCRLSFYLDGVLFGTELEEVVPLSTIVAVEVYTNRVMPARYQGTPRKPSCGAVAVWTGIP